MIEAYSIPLSVFKNSEIIIYNDHNVLHILWYHNLIIHSYWLVKKLKYTYTNGIRMRMVYTYNMSISL